MPLQWRRHKTDDTSSHDVSDPGQVLVVNSAGTAARMTDDGRGSATTTSLVPAAAHPNALSYFTTWSAQGYVFGANQDLALAAYVENSTSIAHDVLTPSMPSRRDRNWLVLAGVRSIRRPGQTSIFCWTLDGARQAKELAVTSG